MTAVLPSVEQGRDAGSFSDLLFGCGGQNAELLLECRQHNFCGPFNSQCLRINYNIVVEGLSRVLLKVLADKTLSLLINLHDYVVRGFNRQTFPLRDAFNSQIERSYHLGAHAELGRKDVLRTAANDHNVALLPKSKKHLPQVDQIVRRADFLGQNMPEKVLQTAPGRFVEGLD